MFDDFFDVFFTARDGANFDSFGLNFFRDDASKRSLAAAGRPPEYHAHRLLAFDDLA